MRYLYQKQLYQECSAVADRRWTFQVHVPYSFHWKNKFNKSQARKQYWKSIFAWINNQQLKSICISVLIINQQLLIVSSTVFASNLPKRNNCSFANSTNSLLPYSLIKDLGQLHPQSYPLTSSSKELCNHVIIKEGSLWKCRNSSNSKLLSISKGVFGFGGLGLVVSSTEILVGTGSRDQESLEIRGGNLGGICTSGSKTRHQASWESLSLDLWIIRSRCRCGIGRRELEGIRGRKILEATYTSGPWPSR
jgi:hypothetical protein